MDLKAIKNQYPDARMVEVEQSERMLTIADLAVNEYGHQNVKCIDSYLKINRNLTFYCAAIFSEQAFRE